MKSHRQAKAPVPARDALLGPWTLKTTGLCSKVRHTNLPIQRPLPNEGIAQANGSPQRAPPAQSRSCVSWGQLDHFSEPPSHNLNTRLALALLPVLLKDTW